MASVRSGNPTTVERRIGASRRIEPRRPVPQNYIERNRRAWNAWSATTAVRSRHEWQTAELEWGLEADPEWLRWQEAFLPDPYELQGILNRRLLRQEHFDQLIDPGRPLAAGSVRVHGITPAMLAGAPPLADAALLVNPEDVDALADAMVRLVEDQNLREVMRAYGLDEIEVSERDILHGSALSAALSPA